MEKIMFVIIGCIIGMIIMRKIDEYFVKLAVTDFLKSIEQDCEERRKKSYSSYKHTYENNIGIIVQDRERAEQIIDKLQDIMTTYGEVTSADLNDLSGLSVGFSDYKYGWKNINFYRSMIKIVHDGYMIMLPKPILLDAIKEEK